MLKDVIGVIENAALRHKGVYTFRYQGDDKFNAQNNNRMYQVYVDDVSMHELNITTNIFKVRFDIYVMGQPTGESGNTILDVQDNAYTIAVDIMAFIDSQEEYKGILSVYDYSILTFSHFTDDNACGVKLSLVLEVPSPLSWCNLDDNFDDEPHEEPKDHEIDISGDTVSEELEIKTIKLPRNRAC